MPPARHSKCTRTEFPDRAPPTKRACKPRASSLAKFDAQLSPRKVSNRGVGHRKARSRSPVRTPTVKEPPLPVFDPTTAFNKEAHYVSICITPNIEGERKDKDQILLGIDLNDLHRDDLYRDDLEKIQSSFYDDYVKEWEQNRGLEGGNKTRVHWSVTIGNPEGNHLKIRVQDQKLWELVEASLRRMKCSGDWRHCNTLFVEAFFKTVDLDQPKSMVGEKVSEFQSDSVAVCTNIDGLVKQIQSERCRLEIPRSTKLDIDIVSGKCVYQCQLSDCTMPFENKNQLKVVKIRTSGYES